MNNMDRQSSARPKIAKPINRFNFVPVQIYDINHHHLVIIEKIKVPTNFSPAMVHCLVWHTRIESLPISSRTSRPPIANHIALWAISERGPPKDRYHMMLSQSTGHQFKEEKKKHPYAWENDCFYVIPVIKSINIRNSSRFFLSLSSWVQAPSLTGLELWNMLMAKNLRMGCHISFSCRVKK